MEQHKAAARLPQDPTIHIERYLHNMYSLPYGSPHRRIKNDKIIIIIIIHRRFVLQHLNNTSLRAISFDIS